MKKSLIIFAIFVMGTFILSAQTEKDIKAGIKHVTVFPDRAQIYHETSINLLPGKTILKLSDLSPYIDQQSVQVKGYGDFTILSVNHRNNYLENLENAPELQSLRDKMEKLQLLAEDERAAISVLKEKGAFLNANKTVLLKESSISVENIKGIIDLYTAGIDQVTTMTLKKERIIKDYDKQIIAIQQQISAMLGKERLPSGEIAVTITTDKQVSGKLSLSYVVSNAGWYPSYDIRVDNTKDPVKISFKANVFQSSGVSWKDAKLSFSNATPWIAGDIPVIYPWFIDYYIPQVPVIRGLSNNKRASAVPEPAAATAPIMFEKMAEAAPPVVQKQIGETSVTFDVAEPYTISSDGKVQTVEIQRIEAPAIYNYVTIPKASKYVYLTANIPDWAKLSLQSGEATLYFENSFVGKSNLNVNQLTDTMVISLGTDNGILVNREKRKEFTSSRVIGANKTETYSFLITVRNNKQNSVKLTLKDQVPISSNSGITVEPLELSGGKHNTITGEINWDLEMKPGETKQIVLTYSIRYPKDKKVITE